MGATNINQIKSPSGQYQYPCLSERETSKIVITATESINSMINCLDSRESSIIFFNVFIIKLKLSKGPKKLRRKIFI
jgi:hypothetical protein